MSTMQELREKHREPATDGPIYRLCPCCLLIDEHKPASIWWPGSSCAECETMSPNRFPEAGSNDARRLVLDAIEAVLKRQPMSEAERNRARKAFAIVHDEWRWEPAS